MTDNVIFNFDEFRNKPVTPSLTLLPFPPTPNNIHRAYRQKYNRQTNFLGTHESLESKLGDILRTLLFNSLKVVSSEKLRWV